MPRQFLLNRCKECRRRRTRCDGKHPRCSSCLRINRECVWPSGSDTTTRSTRNPRLARASPLQGPACPSNFISANNPEVALASRDVFSLFRHYITHLASWYDLNDRKRYFTDQVPVRARRSPLLLSAILAFSAASKRDSDNGEPLAEKAAFYHLESVQILLERIRDAESEQDTHKGEVLAAICLLRSYEIIAQKLDSQCHLQGCYSLLACHPVTSNSGLARAAFWNYLREDITMALIERRRLMIELFDDHLPPKLDYDCDYANYVTVLLGQVINHCFVGANARSEWESLRDRLDSWNRQLPESFELIVGHWSSRAVFPTMAALQGWHAAAIQYYEIAMITLELAKAPPQASTALENMEQVTDLTRQLDRRALKICALALSSDSQAVWVNSFGPIAFCGSWIQNQDYMNQVIEGVQEWGTRTGWPVVDIVRSVRTPFRSFS